MFIISFTNLFSLFDVILNICMTAEIAQLGERQTEDLKVPGSNTENSLRHEFWIIPGLGNFFPEFYSYKTSCLFSQFYSFLAAVETRFASVSKKVCFNCWCSLVLLPISSVYLTLFLIFAWLPRWLSWEGVRLKIWRSLVQIRRTRSGMSSE